MTQTPLINGAKFCKYDQYLHPNVKKTFFEVLNHHHSKKLSMHKHRLSGLINPSNLNKTTDLYAEPIQTKSSHKIKEEYAPFASHTPSYNATLFRKNIDNSIGKPQQLKLQKIFPKSVTIKFQQVLDSIPNNRNVARSNNLAKLNKTISPFKIFQMAQNKFYLDLLSQNKKQSEKSKQNQNNQTKIDSLFNVRSIKMIKKLTQSIPSRQQTSPNSFEQFKTKKKITKYSKMFKNQTDISVEYEKQNPKLFDSTPKFNMKLSLKQLRKLQEYQTSSKHNSNRRGLLPLSQLQNRQTNIKPKKNKRNQSGNMSWIQQNSDNRNQVMTQQNSKNLRKNSKQFIPMVFSLTQDLNSSGITNGKLFDNRFLIAKKPDALFQQKINKYMAMLRTTASINEIQIVFPQIYSRNQFCFYVGKGNNSKLVKDTLKRRWWLGSCQDKKDLQKNNVIWTQLKDKVYYLYNQKNCDQEKQALTKLTIHNHFQQNEFLGNKKALYYNMRAYYRNINENVFSYLPLTFHIKSMQDQSWTQFLQYFKKQTQQNESKNIWILKPGQNSNRGNGITVHQSLQTILSVVTQCQKSGRTYILQKYIQKPFLYNKRKFDIRCYMLLTRLNGKIKGYWYKEGYIRTSGYQFNLDDCQNSFVHLTNDAIQQHCDNYGKFQDKNKLSYQSFQKYLDTHYNTAEDNKKFDFQADILPKLKKVCIDSIKACYKCLGPWRVGIPTFELFGLDFMIDEEFNPWLIQINTNPCLQTQGRVLQKVIVPLVDNVFKLSIDCLFPPPLNWSNSNKHLVSKNVDKTGFELVFDESKQQQNCGKNDSIKQLPMDRIGQIDQDNEIYEQQQE